MGAYSIANVLRKAGYNILVVDMFSKLTYDELVDTLKSIITEETLFLGYSTTFFFQPDHPIVPLEGGEDQFVELNQTLKQLFPDLQIVLGGGSAMAFSDLVKKRECYLDYIVYGFADDSIIHLVNSLSSKEQPHFDSIVGNTKFITNDIKGEKFDFRNSEHFWSDEDAIQDGECLPIEVGRGCIFKCAFCTFPLIGKSKNDLSYVRLEETILAEIVDNYEKHNTKTYFVVDDTFNERSDKIEMMARIRDKSKIDLNFIGYCRLDLIARKPEQLQLLKDMNFNGFHFGIETLNEASAKAIGKHIPAEELIDTMHQIKYVFDDKVNIQVPYIAGLPYETPEILDHWVSRLMREDSPIDSFGVIPLWMSESVEGKSKIFSDPAKYGYTIENGHDWKNEHWTYQECIQLAQDYNNKLIQSGRMRMGCFTIAGLLKFGYDYYDLIKMPMKEYLETISPKLPELAKKHQDQYFSDLFSFIQKK